MRIDLEMKRTRKAKGLTQAKLAKKLGYTAAYIWQIENRYSKTTKETALRLLKALKGMH
jgi:transcriptional regulator with XRE-family HTH domain